jgi:hypothetical protein
MTDIITWQHVIDEEIGVWRERAEKAEAEIERLRETIKVVVETFERDEAQGYRSRDRRYAIDILRMVLPR